MESETLNETSMQKTCQVLKVIKKRKIVHKTPKLKQNKNLSKWILGTCWEEQRNQILEGCPLEIRDQVEEALNQVREWVHQRTAENRKGRDSLNINHLKRTFGSSENQMAMIKGYYCSQVFFNFLSDNLFKIITGSRKIQKTLTYLFYLEKFTARLGNPELLHHLQSL